MIGGAVGGKTIEQTFEASPARVFEAARQVVANLGFSVLHSDVAGLVISFNTGRSMSSFAGQDLTATVFADSGGSRVVVGGSLATRGSPFGGGSQLGSWGEKGRLSRRFLDEVGALIPSIPEPAPRTDHAATGSDLTSELARLGELRNAGVIDDEEFAAAKAKLLAT